MKKRIASLIMIGCLVALVGCGSKTDDTETKEETAKTETVTENKAEEAAPIEVEPAPEDVFSAEDVMAKIIEFYTKTVPVQGDYTIIDTENYDDGDTMEFTVRYCMSDEEAQEIIDNDGMPEANIYVTTVTVDKATLEAVDESGTRFYVSPDTEYEQVVSVPLGEFAFEDVAGQSFMFSSGAGGWYTEVIINADGTFSGEYSDSDMGDTGDEYPDGTHYYCNFDGKFDPPKMIDDYTFEFYLDTMDCHAPADKETIVDGTREVFAAPAGMQDAGKMRIYLPGTPVYMLSDEVKSWLFLDDGATALNTYVLENINTEEAFVGNF